MVRIVALIVSLLMCCASAAGAGPMAVLPSATDSRIAISDEPHICWTPTVQPRGSLVVFLPGTGGRPKEHFRFAEVAAGLGYHVIALMYPDALAAQKVAADSPDPNADLRFRLAIVAGGPIESGTGGRGVDAADSIQNRLEKLLVYLSAHDPDRHWDQFLDPDGHPRWDRIVVAGASQGGGHAYVLGKIHPVERVLMFASPKDYNERLHRPASGFDEDTKTPPDRFFAFNHVRDNQSGCTHEQQAEALAQMGLTRLGIANVEQETAPYHHAHVLYTNKGIPEERFHNSVIRRDYVDVWRYMLTEPAP